MGRFALATALLLTLLALTQLSMCGADEHVPSKDQREGRTEPAAPSSYFKSWGDWATGKFGYGKKDGQTPVQQSQVPPDSANAGGWSNWAFDKISSFSSRASKDAGKAAGKAAQAGKEKLKAEKEAAAKEGEDVVKGAKEGSDKVKGGVKEGSEKVKGGAKESSEKAKEYASKAKEGVHEGAHEQAGKTYAPERDVKQEAEL